ncbi:MAG TPA: hypothetical protein VIR30_09920 [Nocardioides sp.]
MPTINDELLHGQLQHHWAGASAGVHFFERVAGTHGDPRVAEEIGRLAAEVREDRESLRNIMLSVGANPSMVATVGARAGELVARLKPNGRIVRRSPLTDVLELEALRTAVNGKQSGWELLRAVADHDGRLDPKHLDELLRRGKSQLSRLAELHLGVALDLIVGDGSSTRTEM